MTKEKEGALAGIRVLDLTRVLAGPWCTQTLADMGADVIKVEKPGTGDDTRHWGPPFLLDKHGQSTEQASYFASCNRNKRSITIDFSTSEGASLLRRMAGEMDILVENYKVDGLEGYGLDYASLSALNPRLIYCSITGFGQTGPYAKRAGYDLLVQAASGMMSITGLPPGPHGDNGSRVGVAITDIFTGLYASTAILGALEARHRTGKGQYIDMALLDVGMAILANQASGYLNTQEVPKRQGNSHPSLVPYQDFTTADGAVLLAVGNDSQFARFAEIAGHPEWANDLRFSVGASRVTHREILIPFVAAAMKKHSTSYWIAALENASVPCGPINDIRQAFDDPQVISRGLKINQIRNADDGITNIVGVRSPIRMSETPTVLRWAPPALGEHTEEILAEFGLAQKQEPDRSQSGSLNRQI